MPEGAGSQQLVLYGIIIVLFIIATGAVILLIRNVLANRKNQPQSGNKNNGGLLKSLLHFGKKTVVVLPKKVSESDKPDASGPKPSTAPVGTAPNKTEFGANPALDRSKEKFDINEIVKPDKKPISAESINTDFPYSSLTPKTYVSPEDKAAAELAKKEAVAKMEAEKLAEIAAKKESTKQPTMPPGAIPMPSQTQTSAFPIGAMMPGPIEIPMEDESIAESPTVNSRVPENTPAMSPSPMVMPTINETLPERAPVEKVSSATNAPASIQDIMTSQSPVKQGSVLSETPITPLSTENKAAGNIEVTEPTINLPPLPTKNAVLGKPDFSQVELGNTFQNNQNAQHLADKKAADAALFMQKAPEVLPVRPSILPEIQGVPELHRAAAAPIVPPAVVPQVPPSVITTPPAPAQEAPAQSTESPILTQEAFAEKPKSSFDPLTAGIDIGMSATPVSTPAVAPTPSVEPVVPTMPVTPPTSVAAPTTIVFPDVVPQSAPLTAMPEGAPVQASPIAAPVVPQTPTTLQPQTTGDKKFNPLDSLLP